MRGKLVALVALMAAAAICQYLLVPRSARRSDFHALASGIMAPEIGNFRLTRHLHSRLLWGVEEVGASYSDGGGARAELVVRLGERTTHNGVACAYVQDSAIYWQRLRAVKTATATVVFDTALLDNNGILTLAANTECSDTGCREALVPEGNSLWMPRFATPARAPTPVSIIVTELTDPPGQSRSVQGQRLVNDFQRFAASLDLTSLSAPHGRKKRGQQRAD